MYTDPLKTLKRLAVDRYPEAKAVFWSGSVSRGEGTRHSDLDLVIVYPSLVNAYRETFDYQNWLIDACVHDPSTVQYFFDESKKTGIAGLAHMLIGSISIIDQNELSDFVLKLANQTVSEGPRALEKKEIDDLRFIVTDALSDIEDPVSFAEQTASAVKLHHELAKFYFRVEKRWFTTGKSVIRFLKAEDNSLAFKFHESFEQVFKTGETELLRKFVIELLEPYGGLLWENYHSWSDYQPGRYKASCLIKPEKIFSNERFDFFIDHSDSIEYKKIIWEGMKADNESKVGPYRRQPFNLFVRHQSDKTVAGLSGHYLGSLCVLNLFWVDETFKEQGIAEQLFERLSDFAKARGCEWIQAQVAEFQSLDVYQKNGFEVIATLDKGFLDHDQFILRKSLSH